MTEYFAHIFNYLNYGILLWGNHTASQKISVLQKRFVRIICGASPRSHCKPLFIQLGLITLPSMLVLTCLLHVRKNISCFTICSQIHEYTTRNNSNIYINRCKYTATQKSFEFISIQLYNSIPIDIKKCPLLAYREGHYSIDSSSFLQCK